MKNKRLQHTNWISIFWIQLVPWKNNHRVYLVFFYFNTAKGLLVFNKLEYKASVWLNLSGASDIIEKHNTHTPPHLSNVAVWGQHLTMLCTFPETDNKPRLYTAIGQMVDFKKQAGFLTITFQVQHYECLWLCSKESVPLSLFVSLL